MKKYGTQQQRVIKYMNDFGSITSAEAIMEIGVYRLASRISDLKKMGYSIEKTMVAATNRYGETVHFAKYKLREAV